MLGLMFTMKIMKDRKKLNVERLNTFHDRMAKEPWNNICRSQAGSLNWLF